MTSMRHLSLALGLLFGTAAALLPGCSAGDRVDPEGSGGVTGSGGDGTGGSGRGGATGSGGARGSGGTTGSGGAPGSGGATGSGGAAGKGGAGGSPGSGGTTGAGGSGGGSCGSTTRNEQPFGCAFAWGTNSSGGSLSSYGYLQFVSNWVGTEIQQNGSINSCSGCTWLTKNVAATNLVPVFYAYFIGYLGHANGFPDQNTASGGANLSTGGAYLIRKYRSQIVAAYATYAKQAYAAWPTKPLVWLLEGDLVQYTNSTHRGPRPARRPPPSRRCPTRSWASWPPISPARSRRTCRTPWWPSITRPGTPTT
jgi:hypothetical protein